VPQNTGSDSGFNRDVHMQVGRIIRPNPSKVPGCSGSIHIRHNGVHEDGVEHLTYANTAKHDKFSERVLPLQYLTLWKPESIDFSKISRASIPSIAGTAR
jgi:predicted transcriptional regulator with HTH domain